MIAAALAFSWFWLAVVAFIGLLMLGFSTPLLAAKAGERVVADLRPAGELVFAVDGGQKVTEADDDPDLARDADAVRGEQEDGLRPRPK